MIAETLDSIFAGHASVESLSSLLAIAALVVFSVWEARLPRRAGHAPSAHRWFSNIAVYLIGIVIVAWAIGEPGRLAVGLGVPVEVVTRLFGEQPLIAGFAGVLVVDALHYGLHRLYHGVRPMWWLHAVHHSDREVDASTAFRHHPVEIALTSVLLGLAFGVLAIPLWVILLHAALAGPMSVLQHANVELPGRLDEWLRPLLVTPAFHRPHHSIDRRESDTNYGLVFSFWDRMFGTAIEPTHDKAADDAYGVVELGGPAASAFAAMMLTPLTLSRARRQRA